MRLEISFDVRIRSTEPDRKGKEKEDWLERPSSTECSNQIFTKSRIKDSASGLIYDKFRFVEFLL